MATRTHIVTYSLLARSESPTLNATISIPVTQGHPEYVVEVYRIDTDSANDLPPLPKWALDVPCVVTFEDMGKAWIGISAAGVVLVNIPKSMVPELEKYAGRTAVNRSEFDVSCAGGEEDTR